MAKGFKETLAEIRTMLLSGDYYQNEELARISIVVRILNLLGWDIWNPKEVYLEYSVVPGEDYTKVDIALFLRPNLPSVFIEVKAVGKLMNSLPATEKQVRDYNRNNTAQYCVLTDGRYWRFYYCYWPGDFANKCFLAIDILEKDYDDTDLFSLLVKNSISGEGTEKFAKETLEKLSRNRIVISLVHQAIEISMRDRRVSQVNALIDLAMSKHGIVISESEAEEALNSGEFSTSYVTMARSLSEKTAKPLKRVHSRNIETSRSETLLAENTSFTSLNLFDKGYTSKELRARLTNESSVSNTTELRVWLVPCIIKNLIAHGGKARRDEVVLSLKTEFPNLASRFTESDKSGRTRFEGAVDFARLALRQNGIIKTNSSRGYWELEANVNLDDYFDKSK